MTTRTMALAGAAWMAAVAVWAQGTTMPERRLYVVSRPPATGMDCAVLRDRGLVTAVDEGAAQDELTVRLFDQLGAPRGAAQVVSEHAFSPRVAARGDGFVVVWEDPTWDSLPRGQAFSAAGARVGAEFAVGLGTALNEGAPRVLGTPDGGFVVAWMADGTQGGEGFDVFARLYSPSGVAGPAFRVNAATANDQGFGLNTGDALGVAADGSFMVVWSARDANFQGLGVFARRFDASGNPQGGDIQVSAHPLDVAGGVAVAADGTRLVVWQRGWSGLTDVLARRFDAAGAALGPEFKVNVDAGLNLNPVVVAGASSSFTIAWRHGANEGLLRPTTRAVASDGSFTGPPAAAGVTEATYLHAAADVTAGGHALCWFQSHVDFLDPFTGVLARRYAAFAPEPATLDHAGSGGNGVLDPGERVQLHTGWRNHGDAAVPALTGEALAFGGPGAPAFTLYDDTAAYGAAAAGATTGCAAAADCYEVGVAFDWNGRPSVHWDASLDERLSTGQIQRWRVHVGHSFWDVSPTSPYYRFAETLLHQGVTSGCGPISYAQAPFCPASAVTREQIAPFVLVAREGAGYRPFPSAAPPMFTDVAASSPFRIFIEELARRGVVNGCAPGAYCPQREVTRAEASVIVLRTLDPGLTPPPCGTPVFQDVPASSPFCPWVEELARRGVVSGCADGLFCPDASLTREQMAVLLTQAFELALYGY